MSSSVPAAMADDVRKRASNRCEYCRLAQAGQEATFHIDHVHPRSLGGATILDNLALACVSCSLRKGAAVEAIDPETEAMVAIFHPRTEAWDDHFEVQQDGVIAGLTASGRATIARLRINRALAVAIRAEEMARGRYP